MSDDKKRSGLIKPLTPREARMFRPMWVRVVLAVAVAAWCGFEFFYGELFWGVLVLAAFAYLFWMLFIAFPEAEAAMEEDDTNANPPS